MIPEHIRLRAMEVAMNMYSLDITESPAHSNAGFFIDIFKERFGGKPGWAWCMYFVQWCFWLAYKNYKPLYPNGSPLLFRHGNGDIDTTKPNGHCYSIWHKALHDDECGIILAADIANGEKMPAGSIYIRYKGDHTGHTGIVVSHRQDHDNHDRDIIKVIEGNASDAVSLRKYTLQSMMGNNLKGVIY